MMPGMIELQRTPIHQVTGDREDKSIHPACMSRTRLVQLVRLEQQPMRSR